MLHGVTSQKSEALSGVLTEAQNLTLRMQHIKNELTI
jgi:hypothetical protein